MFLIVLQPDLGVSFVLCSFIPIIILLKRIRPLILVTSLILVLLCGVIGWNSLLKDYQKNRIISFLNPSKYKTSIGYQIIQSRIAIGSGGLSGKGYLKGSQSQYQFLPARHTDFIISVIGEELGFISIAVLFFIFFIVFYRQFKFNFQSDEEFYFIYLFNGLILFQFLINVAMAIGLFPVLGISLPFRLLRRLVAAVFFHRRSHHFPHQNQQLSDMNAQELLAHLQNPQAYIGREINSCRDGFDRNNINVCLVFPDTYAIGMSHSGLKILYHLLNGMDGVHAERAFLPEAENLAVFKENGVPLFSLENKIPLKDFDLIGFSLSSELNFTNVLQVLDLAGLPLFSAQRQEGYPLVGAGGIAVANPEPLRAVIDFFAFGDGEAIFPDLIAVLKNARKESTRRQAVLESFAALPGIYVPSLYPLKKIGRFLVPDLGGKTIRKRICPDLDRLRAEAERSCRYARWSLTG